MPSFSQTQWTSCKKWSLDWAAPTGTQSCTVFGYKDFCGSTVLGMLESVGMNRQIDWQAQQITYLVCSSAGQRCSEAWRTFWIWTDQCITALIAWRKEEWKKEAADIPPCKVENDLCSIRQILALFRGQPWGECWEMGRSVYGLFWALRSDLELKLKLKLKLSQEVSPRHFCCFVLGYWISQPYAMCILEMNLIRQSDMLPHWDWSRRSNLLSHPVTVH